MIGYTTGVTFDSLVTQEQATNGFIGRALLVNERETNPRARRGFKAKPMPDSMRALLWSLHTGGNYDTQGSGRVEFYGDKIPIKTEPAAVEMMDRVLDWVESYAEEHKSTTGLEPVVRRGFEIMAKIAFILGAPEGLITTEHVRWSYAMMRRDIDDKTRLAYANMVEKDSPMDAIAMRIMNMLDSDHGETTGVIAHRFRPRKPDEIKTVLEKMEELGKIKRVESEHAFSKKTITKWYCV